MVQRIKNDKILSKFIEDTCCEEGVCVQIDKKVSKDDVVIIKVDNYYNSTEYKKISKKRPPSPDCLIVQNCKNGNTFKVTIVELKSASEPRNIKKINVIQKYDTCLNSFMQSLFPQYFLNEVHRIKNIELFLVSNVEIYDSAKGKKSELFLSLFQNTELKFLGNRYKIKPIKPTPTITPCY